jgi:hypothetical protein
MSDSDETSAATQFGILLIPSFWGFCTWMVWLALYSARLVAWYPSNPVATIAFIGVAACFLGSMIIFRRPYRDLAARQLRSHPTRKPLAMPARATLLALHGIGLLGVALYVRDMARALGGWQQFFASLLYASQLIRLTLEETTSFGVQLSYVGWVAVGLSVCFVRRRQVSSWFLVFSIVQGAANILFMDRTRPIWIGFTTALVALSVSESFSARKLVRNATWGLIGCAVCFAAIAIWIGKTPEEGAFGNSPLPLSLQYVYSYGTAGFAYFNEIVARLTPTEVGAQRVLYPLFKLLARLSLTTTPPPQVNDIYWVPFPINVGTFLEPWYRDGGILLATIGVLAQSVGQDFLGLLLLRNGRPLARFAWSNLCFASFIAFFTPKFNNLPFWLFVGLGTAGLAADAIRHRIDKRLASASVAPEGPTRKV